jgi:hypothetical protein
MSSGIVADRHRQMISLRFSNPGLMMPDRPPPAMHFSVESCKKARPVAGL